MANADIAEEEVVEAAPPAPKKKGKKLAVIGAVAVLALGGGGFALMHSHGANAPAKKVVEAPKGPELFLPLDPPFVVNFADQDATRYLQVGVTVMSRDADAVQAMKDTDPVIRNALVLLFSGQTSTSLGSTAGKEKLQAQALDAVRKIVADKTGKADGVEALYFTSFVIQ